MGQFGIIQFKLIMALFQDKTNLQTEQMIAEAQKPKQTIKPPTAQIKEERENTHFSYVSKNMTLQVSNERIFQTKFSPDTSMLAMSGDDFKKLQDLHCRQHIRDSCPALLAELEVLWQLGRKAEIQQLSEDREPGYLAHSYIASKVAWAGQRAARGLHMF